MIYPRHLKTRILKCSSSSPVIFLTGGRQTGKTTLMKEIGRENSFNYITFDDIRLLSAAKADPIGILDQFSSKPLIIDEIQRVPEISLPLKYKIDENRKNGLFLLTGSSNPLVIPKLNDSLAGRLFLLNLWPLSYSEILQTPPPTFIENLFQEKWEEKSFRRLPKEEIFSAILKGGYPSVQDLSSDIRDEWFNNHLRTILERDVQDLAQIRKIDELPLLMQILANRTGNLLNISELSRISRIPYTTLNFYLTLLEALYLIIRQPSWHKNPTKRISKSTKIYLTDTGIASFLIGANEKRFFSDPSLLGSLFETFVIMEIEKLLSFSSFYLNSFHYRSSQLAEVDLVIENRAGEIVGIEIKSSETVREDDFKGLKKLQEESDVFLRGFVLYPGKDLIPFGKNLFALPLSSLF